MSDPYLPEEPVRILIELGPLSEVGKIICERPVECIIYTPSSTIHNILSAAKIENSMIVVDAREVEKCFAFFNKEQKRRVRIQRQQEFARWQDGLWPKSQGWGFTWNGQTFLDPVLKHQPLCATHYYGHDGFRNLVTGELLSGDQVAWPSRLEAVLAFHKRGYEQSPTTKDLADDTSQTHTGEAPSSQEATD